MLSKHSFLSVHFHFFLPKLDLYNQVHFFFMCVSFWRGRFAWMQCPSKHIVWRPARSFRTISFALFIWIFFLFNSPWISLHLRTGTAIWTSVYWNPSSARILTSLVAVLNRWSPRLFLWSRGGGEIKHFYDVGKPPAGGLIGRSIRILFRIFAMGSWRCVHVDVPSSSSELGQGPYFRESGFQSPA